MHYLDPVEAKKIGQEALLRVSAHGDGLYLFIPRDFVEVYDIKSGDRIKVDLQTRYRLSKSIGNLEKESLTTVLVKPRKKVKRRKKQHGESSAPL